MTERDRAGQGGQHLPDAPGLLTINDERLIPLPPDTLPFEERQELAAAAEAIVLDLTRPAPLPLEQDLFVAEPLHPAVGPPPPLSPRQP
jgi:hypothetical protein